MKLELRKLGSGGRWFNAFSYKDDVGERFTGLILFKTLLQLRTNIQGDK